MYKYIVYKTTNKVNSKTYIGVHRENIGKGGKYIGNGLYSNTSKADTHFRAAVKKYGYENFVREVLYEYPDTEEGCLAAYAKEAELVTLEVVDNPMTYNMCLGGKLQLFEGRKKKIAQYTLEGKFITTFDSITEAQDATGLNGITNAVLGISKYCGDFQWKPYTNEEDIDPVTTKEKTVYQFDLQGNLIKVWKSTSEASRGFENSNSARVQIQHCCNGERPQALGYYWSYKRHFDYKDIYRKAVAKYDDEGNFIESYSSLKDAAQAVGLKDSSAISNCIRGKSKHAKGYRWRLFYGNKSNIGSL